MLGCISMSYSAGGKTILNGVSLSIAPNECVVIEGPSGSGKSLLLKLLLRDLDPTQGSVEVDAVDLKMLPPGVLQLYRQRLGVVFQEPRLLMHLTLLENVALPALLRGEENAEAMRKAGEQLSRFGLAESADKKPDSLAPGIQRLASIARALSGSPPILLLDEPLLGLDPAESQAALGALGAANQGGASLLILTQDASQFAGLGGRKLTLGPQGLFSGSMPAMPSPASSMTPSDGGDKVAITAIGA